MTRAQTEAVHGAHPGCSGRSNIEHMRASTIAGAVTLLLIAGSPLRGQEPSAENVAEGMRLYRTKADCQACHGWAGDGRKMDTQMPVRRCSRMSDGPPTAAATI